MLITLIFLAVAGKSRTFSSFSYSANEQVCRSWEAAQPASQPKLASGIIPYHRRHAPFINGGWLGGQEFALLFSVSSNPLWSSSLNFSRHLVFFGSLVKFAVFQVLQLLLRDWLRIDRQVVRKLYCI